MTCQVLFFFFQAEDGIRDLTVTGVQTCALPISSLPISVALEESIGSLRNLDSRLTDRSVRAATRVTTSSTETFFLSSKISFLMNSSIIFPYFVMPSPASSISWRTLSESLNANQQWFSHRYELNYPAVSRSRTVGLSIGK